MKNYDLNDCNCIPPFKSLSKEGEGEKRRIVSKKVFGSSLEKSDPKAGLTELTIQVDEIGNIPGISEHWQYDLARRKKDIVKLTERTFMQRAVTIFRKDALSAANKWVRTGKILPD